MQRRNMPGGYSPAELDNPQLAAAAVFAVSGLSEADKSYSFASALQGLEGSKVKVAKAWQQVVAGMNFRMVILIENAEGGCVGAFAATVYDHFGDLSVTKWGKEIECEKAKAMVESQESFGEGFKEHFDD